jgi:acetyl esterase/lipase
VFGVLGRWSRAGVVCVSALLLAMGSPAVAAGPPQHAVGQVISNITYCRDGSEPQTLDILYPKIKVTYPRPVVLWVHGGTWIAGSKDNAARIVYVQALRRAGFIVAAMNYALAPHKKFPAQTQDLTCGIRFLRAKARQYGIDAAHVGVMGGSAGGHLVQMLGVNNGSHIFNGGGYANYSSDVQAVVSLWGVSDLTRRDLDASDEATLPGVFGKFSLWAAASPIKYVRAGLPPFLLVHGNRDTDVPVRQSKRMYRTLLAAKVPATLVVVQNAGHGLVPAGGTDSPSVSAVESQIVTFFKSAFKH